MESMDKKKKRVKSYQAKTGRELKMGGERLIRRKKKIQIHAIEDEVMEVK